MRLTAYVGGPGGSRVTGMASSQIAIVGILLVGYALVSRRLDRTPITMPIVFVAAGAIASLTGVVVLGQELAAVALLAEATLAVILFSDATRVSLPRLRHTLALPARLLGVGLPLTVLAGTAANVWLFPDWPVAEALVLAAILAPTDAALGSAVVSDRNVPARDRLALNVESGLNDGLVVPVVTVGISLVLGEARSATEWLGFVAAQIGVGSAVGLILGVFAVTLLRRSRLSDHSDGRYEQIATFALPLVALTGAMALGGNGFIAAFVAGLAFGGGGIPRLVDGQGPGGGSAGTMAGPDDAEHLAEFTEDAAELLAAVTFFVFGNLFIDDAVEEFSLVVVAAALLSLTVVRMIPVALALTRSGCDGAAKLFIGWFGPRGLASIVFGILLLEELEAMAETADQLVGVISLTVMFSVVLHGASAAAGARVYARHARGDGPPGSQPTDSAHLPRTRWSPRRRTS